MLHALSSNKTDYADFIGTTLFYTHTYIHWSFYQCATSTKVSQGLSQEMGLAVEWFTDEYLTTDHSFWIEKTEAEVGGWRWGKAWKLTMAGNPAVYHVSPDKQVTPRCQSQLNREGKHTETHLGYCVSGHAGGQIPPLFSKFPSTRNLMRELGEGHLS